MKEEFEDTKGVIRFRKSKKNRQYNGQKKKNKRTNNDIQNITHKTKDRLTRIPLKTNEYYFTRSFASIKHSLKKKIKKVIDDSYSKKTLEKLSSFNQTSKLYIYSKIKSELKLENYLLFFKMRQLFTKSRVSDHSLEIESGRYQNIMREERICKNCNLNEIGDEYHFFLKCTANHSLRNNLFNKMILNKPDFIEEIPLNRITFLLDANSELLAEVGAL